MKPLFRAKALSGEWVQGNFIHSKRFEGCFNEYRIYDQETGIEHDINPETVGQYTGLVDKNRNKIFEGDIMEFADKWEWYRGSYAIKMHFADKERLAKLKAAYENEPMERRDVEMPGSYEWLLSGEIQEYWHIIGNIHDNPEF